MDAYSPGMVAYEDDDSVEGADDMPPAEAAAVAPVVAPVAHAVAEETSVGGAVDMAPAAEAAAAAPVVAPVEWNRAPTILS